MTKIDKINYWLKLAVADLDFANYAFNGEYFLNTVFNCHMALEKALKAAYVEVNEVAPPFVHDLIKLAKKANVYEHLTKEQVLFLEELSPMNVKTRYPEEHDEVLSNLNQQICEDILIKTKGMLEWIRNRLLK